jgi:hypothetical protein
VDVVNIHDVHLMFVGGRGREYDGGLEAVHVGVLKTIWGTAREGLEPAGGYNGCRCQVSVRRS